MGEKEYNLLLFLFIDHIILIQNGFLGHNKDKILSSISI